jgi:hypothetical protein
MARPRRPPSRAPKIPTYQSLLGSIRIETPKQLQARANQMVKTQFKAGQAAIRAEAAQIRQEAEQRQRAMSAGGQAAAKISQDLLASTGGEYDAAARELTRFGGGLTDATAAQNAAAVAASNAALGRINAPAVTGLPGAQQAEVERYRNVTLPAGAITERGGTAKFGLAGLIENRMARSEQEAIAALQQTTREANKARTSAMKELAAGRPAAAQQFLIALQDANRQQVALASGLIQQRTAGQQRQEEIGIQRTNAVTNRQQTQAQIKLAQQQEARNAKILNAQLDEVDVNRSLALGYVVNKRGTPIKGDNGKKIPSSTLATSSTSGTKGASLTPGQRVKLLQSAQDLGESLFYGYGQNEEGKRVPVTQLGNFDPDDPTTWGNGQVSYPQAIRRLMTMGLNRGAADAILTQWYERGDRGRPPFNGKEEKFLRRKMGADKFGWAKRQYQNLVNQGQIAAAQNLMNEILNNYGRNLSWVSRPG